MVTVVIDGEPVPQARPRMTRNGHTYTPEKSRLYRELVKICARKAMKGNSPVNGALAVTLAICKEVPKSWSKKKAQDAMLGKEFPIGGRGGDIDNFVKAVFDGCNGIVWKDDSQVVMIKAVKKYSSKPCVVMNVYNAPNIED